METTKALSCAIMMCFLIHMADSFCRPYPSTGNNPSNCTYKGVVVALNSTHTDYNICTEITCQADGSMFICGIGINAGRSLPPDGCVTIKGDKCERKVVYANDHTKECHSMEPILG
ncbi:Hypothetical predicted protein [Mytilus galloprovincialis]|uniref:Secreted protein n=2 Tax=Mytilus galloprovincialis TaxID=29158 RepID=A0A8B6D0Z8_MYTGA|nr:Hypothetical predicted protein [Mytilus galloprovincialis]